MPKRSPSKLDRYLDILGEIKGVAMIIEQSRDAKQIIRCVRRLSVLKRKLMQARPRRAASRSRHAGR